VAVRLGNSFKAFVIVCRFVGNAVQAEPNAVGTLLFVGSSPDGASARRTDDSVSPVDGEDPGRQCQQVSVMQPTRLSVFSNMCTIAQKCEKSHF